MKQKTFKQYPKKIKKIDFDGLLNLLIRYVILLIFALLFSLSSGFYNLVYNILLKLTIYPVNFFLNLFYNSGFYQHFIFIDSKIIELIPACVALSAYFLLLILNLTTPLNFKKRFYSLFFSLFLFLLINILRIFILSILFLEDFVYFEQVHKFFWYFLSIVIVAGVWFLTVYSFKIKNIPVYSDFRTILDLRK